MTDYPKCFCCNRPLTGISYLVTPRVSPPVHVEHVCFKAIKAAGKQGYRHRTTEPRLYLLDLIAAAKTGVFA